LFRKPVHDRFTKHRLRVRQHPLRLLKQVLPSELCVQLRAAPCLDNRFSSALALKERQEWEARVRPFDRASVVRCILRARLLPDHVRSASAQDYHPQDLSVPAAAPVLRRAGPDSATFHEG
jgi:hypothetical protein